LFHATPQSSQRLKPIAFDNQCVASVAALRETKMSGSVLQNTCSQLIPHKKQERPLIKTQNSNAFNSRLCLCF
jgi:uncharacterized protein with NAD-binding domain and iron-sulfur cluster